jgi:hypothetical protein
MGRHPLRTDGCVCGGGVECGEDEMVVKNQKLNYMRLLKCLFPKREIDILSNLETFKKERQSKLIADIKKYLSHNPDDQIFLVPGAGAIAVSGFGHSTGGAYGFGIGVSWGQHGFVGGVIGMTEARRLAEYIIEKCSEQTMTEHELLAESKRKMDDCIERLKTDPNAKSKHP